jgi:hypothetical protein
MGKLSLKDTSLHPFKKLVLWVKFFTETDMTSSCFRGNLIALLHHDNENTEENKVVGYKLGFFMVSGNVQF